MRSPSLTPAQLAVVATETRNRIRDLIVETPLIGARTLAAPGRKLSFKCENFQRTGSFKLRGASAKLTRVPIGQAVIAASSGNHGIACAQAAQATGHALTVVLPETVSPTKRQKIEALGASVVIQGAHSGLAEHYAREVAERDGAIYLSPYNDADVVAGQATIGLELLEQAPDLDAVFVAIGGGGLIVGIASVLKAVRPDTRIIGVSAQNSDTLAQSLEAGKVIETEHLPTLADGVAGGMDTDAVTFPLAVDVIDEVISCSEHDIEIALRDLAWLENLVVEGAAALALAGYQKAVAGSDGDDKHKNAVVVLCGGNFDTQTIARVICAEGGTCN